MVKFGKKFFFDAKYEKKTKRKLIIGGIILAIAIIVLIILLNFFKKEDKKETNPKVNENISLRKELLTEVYKALPDKTSYFEKLSNTNLDDVTITYPNNMKTDINVENCPSDSLEEINNILDGTSKGNLDDFSCIYWVPSEIGTYDVNIHINNKDYIVKLNVVDKTAPTITLKPVEITVGDTYSVEDFVESCKDNYDDKCTVTYYYLSYNEDNEIDYSSFTEEGSYTVKIAAKDSSDNLSLPLSTTLTINPKEPDKYLVTFDSNGGTTIDGIYVEEGQVVTKPENPTKNGYTFKEWKLNGVTYDFNNPITKDITLVAEWNKKVEQPVTKPNNSGCKYGNKKYNTNKYILSVYANSNSNCATSKSEFQALRDGPLTNNVIAKDANRLISELGSNATNYEPGYKTLGIFNTAGTGLVGYEIEVILRHNSNGTLTEVARYKIDTNGKRHFSLNTINLPQ